MCFPRDTPWVTTYVFPHIQCYGRGNFFRFFCLAFDFLVQDQTFIFCPGSIPFINIDFFASNFYSTECTYNLEGFDNLGACDSCNTMGLSCVTIGVYFLITFQIFISAVSLVNPFPIFITMKNQTFPV